MASMCLRFAYVLFWISVLASTALSELVISKIDRRIDLTSQIVRVVSSLKVENRGHDTASEVLLAFPDIQAKNMAYLKSSHHEGKGKGQQSAVSLPVTLVQPEGMPSDLTFYSISLPKGLEKEESFTLDVLAVFTHSLKPFPEEITQAGVQLVVYQDSAYYISPYEVRFQTLAVQLPSGRVESYTKYPSTKLVESEIKYGPFENLPPFSYIPIAVHFESTYPFAVVQELEREIEISHWGSIQVTEHYNLVHGGAPLKGGFSRIEYQSRPPIRGESSFRHLVARLPPRAHSVYYRDEIGNISTSHLWSDSKTTHLQIEPRYPMFGGWRTSFTIGYGLPLRDFLYEADGKRFLNITFGCPINEIIINHLIVKVVLPEGSKEMLATVPFVTKQSQEVKYSHLDIVGRPVIVLEKTNVVPEHNVHFQVFYKFNNLALLMEPFLLISGFFFLFIACIVYVHSDASISKFSASYLAKQQLDEVRATVQQALSIINRILAVHNKLETSLRDLSRAGDVQSCKASRKAADGSFKDLAKELKPLLGYLQSSPQASQIWPKVEELLSKEKDMQEKLMAKHSAIVDGFEKKSARREVENRVASIDQKLAILRQEADELLDALDDF